MNSGTVEFVTHPICGGELKNVMKSPEAGAYVEFEGRVRDHNEGKKVIRLVYEAYSSMASSELTRIVDEAKQKFPVINICVRHRLGVLEVGEVAVWVGVVGRHRKECFLACEYVIDQLKRRVPVWKCETYDDGVQAWVGCMHEGRTMIGSGCTFWQLAAKKCILTLCRSRA